MPTAGVAGVGGSASNPMVLTFRITLDANGDPVGKPHVSNVLQARIVIWELSVEIFNGVPKFLWNRLLNCYLAAYAVHETDHTSNSYLLSRDNYDDHSGTDFALMADVHMLLVCESGARERTLPEYRSLLEEAGFRSAELMRFECPLRDVIIARKSGSN